MQQDYIKDTFNALFAQDVQAAYAFLRSQLQTSQISHQVTVPVHIDLGLSAQQVEENVLGVVSCTG